MVEMYTIQRYLDPDGLVERGIDHFDAWAATFGEVVDTMEISPDGKSLRPRSRLYFARKVCRVCQKGLPLSLPEATERPGEEASRERRASAGAPGALDEPG